MVRSLLCLTLLVGGARAATSVRLGLDDLVHAAEAAVQGSIESSRTERDANGYLFTVYMLRVRESYFGARGRRLEFWQAGGIDRQRGIGMLVPGVPQFHDGEEVLVLLARSRSGHLHVLAGEQGVRAPERWGSALREAAARLGKRR